MEICGSIFVPTLSEAKDFFLSQSVTVGPEELCYSLNINNVVDRSRGILFASKMAPERDLPFLIAISKDLHQRERGKRPPLFNGGGASPGRPVQCWNGLPKRLLFRRNGKVHFYANRGEGLRFEPDFLGVPFGSGSCQRPSRGARRGRPTPLVKDESFPKVTLEFIFPLKNVKCFLSFPKRFSIKGKIWRPYKNT